jgi:hypothetical protein
VKRQLGINMLHVRTEGHDIIVRVRVGATWVEMLRTHGALDDVTVDHCVHRAGLLARAASAAVAEPGAGVGEVGGEGAPPVIAGLARERREQPRALGQEVGPHERELVGADRPVPVVGQETQGAAHET